MAKYAFVVNMHNIPMNLANSFLYDNNRHN